MTNADKPFGLIPIKYAGGVAWAGAVNRYWFDGANDSTAAYVGGLVKPSGGDSDADGVMAVTANVATSNNVLGVIVAIEPVTHQSTLYREASTDRYVWVADDPNQLFIVQDDASSTLSVSNVGHAADLTGFTSGSTTSGRSSIEISATSATASGTDEDVLIIGLHDKPDNTVGDNAVWVVRLLNHFYDGTNYGA